MDIILIIITIITLVFLLWAWRLRRNKKFVADKFNDNNVIVSGRKGTGKDLLFQSVISFNTRKNKKTKNKYKYHSNINYGFNYNEVSIAELSLEKNNFKNLIVGNYHLINKRLDFENTQFFISDGGIYLPSQYHYIIDKHFDTLAVFYAIIRHLYNANIHINSQRLNRIYDKLREQADHYILTKKSFRLFRWHFTKLVYYSKYESALAEILPLQKTGLINKYNRADIAKYEAENGIVKEMWIATAKKELHYDTRIFHKKIFGLPFAVLSTKGIGKVINSIY